MKKHNLELAEFWFVVAVLAGLILALALVVHQVKGDDGYIRDYSGRYAGSYQQFGNQIIFRDSSGRIAGYSRTQTPVPYYYYPRYQRRR